MDTVLLKVPQVMARRGLGHTKVYDPMASGELRSVKVGRSRRVPSEELDRFIADLDGDWPCSAYARRTVSSSVRPVASGS